MYDLVDQPVERLCNGSRFLLWATRGWALAMAQGKCPPPVLSRGFAGVQALPALPHFHMAMARLHADAKARLKVAPMGCPRIAEDEAILAGLWRAAASERTRHLDATLAMMTAADAVPAIARAMCETVRRLAAAGLPLSTEFQEPQKENK